MFDMDESPIHYQDIAKFNLAPVIAVVYSFSVHENA